MTKSNFPSFIQHKKWQSPIFRIYLSWTLSFLMAEKFGK
jgi:hypothetical protein